ncbi:MAG: tRNA dihydrouridine synthase, partial [Anaerovoracaceae bacterium]
KVVKNGEGSALLRTPELAGEIVSRLVIDTGLPVTAKIRAGFDDTCINAVEMARILEQAGASAVAVHGRTREQYYEGSADWEIIRRVKNSVSIPVIGNGDVFSAADAIAMLNETGCDFVMIARGALGNPWIFRECNALYMNREITGSPSKEEKQDVLLRHFDDLLKLKGEYAGVREMRKHIGWYIKGIPGAASVRREINQITDAKELRRRIKEI